MAQPFNYPFTSDPKDIQATHGYLLCLQALLVRLEEMTAWKPENRFIDSCELLDAIQVTNNELMKLHRQTAGELIIQSIPKEL